MVGIKHKLHSLGVVPVVSFHLLMYAGHWTLGCTFKMMCTLFLTPPFNFIDFGGANVAAGEEDRLQHLQGCAHSGNLSEGTAMSRLPSAESGIRLQTV